MRYLITGGSGYIGGRLTDELSAPRGDREDRQRRRPPARGPHWPKHEFVSGDVRDRAAIRALLEREEIDALIHLAFILNPIRDEARMYDIDVNGTKAVLAGRLGGRDQAGARRPPRRPPTAPSRTTRSRSPRTGRCAAQPDFAYAKHKADVGPRLPALGARAPGRA